MAKYLNSALISAFWYSSFVEYNLILVMAGSSAAQPDWKNVKGEMEQGDFIDLWCWAWTDVKNRQA